MDSRIILTQADFSANNIGRYVELSDLTKKVLAKQRLYNLDSAEAIALDTFLANLTDGGFIGGSNPLFKYFIIPALASNDDELLYNIAELDNDGYPIDKRSNAEKNATSSMKSFKLYTENDVVKGLYVTKDPDLSTSDFAAQRLQTLDNFFTKGAVYPAMSLCMWCPKVSLTSGDALFEIGGGYVFKMTTALVGLYSANTSDKYLKASVSGLGNGFIGITCDEANSQLTTMLDNGVMGTVESLNASSMKQSSYDDYYKNLSFGFGNNLSSRVFHASVIAFGNALTQEQMIQFKSMLVAFLTSLNIITE